MQDTNYKIYNASAGSGKTYTLVKAYLKIVLSPNTYKNYRQILAITFTNKAVNEMKQRILESLYDFGQTTPPEKASDMFRAISKELKIPHANLQQKAKRVLKEMLHNYAFFDVSTIDKFTHRIIRTFAKDLKLPQNFEVVLDTDLFLNEGVQRLIDKAGTDAKLTAVLLDFALEKIDDGKSWDLAIDLNKIGKLLFDENHVGPLEKLRARNLEAFLRLKDIMIARMKSTEAEACKRAQTVLDLINSTGLEPTDFPRQTLPNHFKKIIDREFDPSKLYNNKLEDNLIAGKILKSGIALPSQELALQILNIYLDIKHLIYHRAFLKNAYKNLVPLTVLNALQQELKVMERERDQLPISSFNTIISNEIKNQPAPFIYERLGEKYRHYFIDEFQDTSEMQWNNLVPLIGNALESEDSQGKKGSLLLVGDAKQAIYRWRGGKAEQFLKLISKQDNPFVIPPEVENLPTNYRSHEEVIKFNNDFFQETSPFLDNKEYNLLFLEGNNQNFNAKKGGFVQLSFIGSNEGKSDDELYYNEVLKAIQEALHKKHPLRDLCILTRKRKHGVLLANFLMEQNIPIISSETLLLDSSPKIRFLVNLLKISVSPQDREACYNILYFLSGQKENGHSFIQQHLESLNRLLLDDYHFDGTLFIQVSVYDGLEYAIKQFALAEGSDAYITHFMDQVLEVEQKGGTSPQAFLEFWEKKKGKLGITAPENIDAVQLMTIHKSKGLEFPIVIFPYANTPIYEEIDPKLWLPVEKGELPGFEEVLINKKQEVVHYGEQAERLYNGEQHKLELDAFNLLYVALTRAIKALYIISKKDLNKDGRCKTTYYSGLFIHYLQQKNWWNPNKQSYSFGTLENNSRTYHRDISQESIPYPYSYRENPNFKIVTKSGMLWESKTEKAIGKGNVVHQLLGFIATEKDLDRAFLLLLQKGDGTAEEIALFKSQVLGVIRHPKLKKYYAEGNIIYNEKEIISQSGLILRPDRIVIENNKATILDYKTGKRNKVYHQQLNSYATALTEMGYSIEKKIIVYIDAEITPEFI